MRWMKEIITSRNVILFHTPRPKIPHEKFIILEKYKNYFTFSIGNVFTWPYQSEPDIVVSSAIMLEILI